MRKARAFMVGLLLGLAGLAWAEGEPAVFSGKTQPYLDPVNGYKLLLPVEFSKRGEGVSTWWEGPVVDGAGASVHINVTEMPGISPQTLYDINLKSTQQKKKEYVQLTPLKLKCGKQTFPGFWYRESDTAPGTDHKKTDSDIHRWYIEAYGNNRAYHVVLGGSFKAFQDGKLPPTYTAIVKSLELTAVK